MVENRKGKEEVQLVVFKIGSEEFGVEINQVREIVKLVSITRMPKAPAFIEGVVNLRGQIITVIDLSKKLDLPSAGKTDSTRIMVVEVADNTVGMIVDSVSEVLRLAKDDIEATPALIDTEVHERYLRGVGKMEDRLLILLDLNEVLSIDEIHHISKQVESIKETVGKEDKS
ncbi:MAG: chemotaxis protein CheW [Candidatus Omnitrophica bacterium]|nr:chemotaxis protein CheW [Candidatus Omnitrophota bacterium]MBU4479496.1 chemotaxis protein CheW [Candidatus Omnitrophota bacterium]MCG2702995.1 chemotaxis protein CheW [Candidatus Omnitrophota bacterium]